MWIHFYLSIFNNSCMFCGYDDHQLFMSQYFNENDNIQNKSFALFMQNKVSNFVANKFSAYDNFCLWTLISGMIKVVQSIQLSS